MITKLFGLARKSSSKTGRNQRRTRRPRRLGLEPLEARQMLSVTPSAGLVEIHNAQGQLEAFGIGSDHVVYMETQFTGGQWSAWSAVTGANTDARSLAAAGNTLYMLGSNGAANETVWQYTGTPGDWTALSGPNMDVKSLVADNGNVYFLTDIGVLYENTATTAVAWNVSSFKFASSGQLAVSTFAATPKAGEGDTYKPISGPLFGPNGPSYLDVKQGDVGDCWLLASLAEVAARDPADIQNMFTYDGTAMVNCAQVSLYTVRFFNNAGDAKYVTLDTELPTVNGSTVYDHRCNGVLWVALAEKAYAEANGAGWVTTNHEGTDSYDALNIGDASWALRAISGKSAGDYSIDPSNIAAAWNAGEFIVLLTPDPAASSHIVGNHYYALVDYNASASAASACAVSQRVVNYVASSQLPYELFNPYGTTSQGWDPSDSAKYGLFTANALFLTLNYIAQTIGSGAAAGQSMATSSAAASGSRISTSVAGGHPVAGWQLSTSLPVAEPASTSAPSAPNVDSAAVDRIMGTLDEFDIGSGNLVLGRHARDKGPGKSLVSLAVRPADALAGPFTYGS